MYEFGCHAFPPTTIEDLELLSNSHMSNSIQYTASQVASYLVATTQLLRQVNPDLAELFSVKVGRDELRTKLLGLEEEKCKFKEC